MTTLARLIQRHKMSAICHEETRKTMSMNKKYREEDSALVNKSFFEEVSHLSALC